MRRRVLVDLAAPRGFGSAYRREAEEPTNPEQLSSLLSLVGYEATAETLSSWPEVKRIATAVYAINVHLRASDNALPCHPPLPWLGEPWQGPWIGEGVMAGPSGTPLK